MLHASKLPLQTRHRLQAAAFRRHPVRRDRKGSVSSKSMPKTTWARAARRMPCCASLRERFALSVHGVGLSIGGEAPLDREHLSRLKALCDRYQPESFSEHLAWSSHGEVVSERSLAPALYQSNARPHRRPCRSGADGARAARCCWKIRPPICNSRKATIPETEFLSAIARRTGCGLLLDVNNVFVQAQNHGTSAGGVSRFLPACAGEGNPSRRP